MRMHIKNVTKNLAVLLFAVFGAFALTGCDNDGPMEEAGENVDEAVEETSESVEEAAEEVEEEVD